MGKFREKSNICYISEFYRILKEFYWQLIFLQVNCDP